jgi:hypothetical protein
MDPVSPRREDTVAFQFCKKTTTGFVKKIYPDEPCLGFGLNYRTVG